MFRTLLAILIALAFSVSLIGCDGGDELDAEKLEKRPPVPAEKRRPAPGPGAAAEGTSAEDDGE
jgi:hypothetical protein